MNKKQIKRKHNKLSKIMQRKYPPGKPYILFKYKHLASGTCCIGTPRKRTGLSIISYGRNGKVHN
jgi:hypothetical protein